MRNILMSANVMEEAKTKYMSVNIMKKAKTNIGPIFFGAVRWAWQGYTDYAWGRDELKPLSKSGQDWFG